MYITHTYIQWCFLFSIILLLNFGNDSSILFCSQSASCVHVSGLLHALVAMNPGPFHAQRTDELQDDEEETPLPITSYACQWKMPCKRKESTLLMSSATFNKHSYGKQKTRTFQSMEDFDPRPVEF